VGAWKKTIWIWKAKVLNPSMVEAAEQETQEEEKQEV